MKMLKPVLIILLLPLFGCPTSSTTGGGDRNNSRLNDMRDFNTRVTDYTSGREIREPDCPNCDTDFSDGRSSTISTPPADMDRKTEQAFRKYTQAGGDPKAFKQALCYLKKKKGQAFNSDVGRMQMNPCILSIQDNTKLSKYYRADKGRNMHAAKLFRVNLCEGKVSTSISGVGYGGICAGQSPCPKESGMTPNGFMLLGGQHNTDKKWGPGIKMFGLEKFNRNNGARGVVLHRAKVNSNETGYYCLDSGVCTGNTAGCTGLTQSFWGQYKHLMNARPTSGGTGVGELHLNYSSYEKGKSENYCGSN